MGMCEELFRAMHQKRLLAQGIRLICPVNSQVISGY